MYVYRLSEYIIIIIKFPLFRVDFLQRDLNFSVQDTTILVGNITPNTDIFVFYFMLSAGGWARLRIICIYNTGWSTPHVPQQVSDIAHSVPTKYITYAMIAEYAC